MATTNILLHDFLATTILHEPPSHEELFHTLSIFLCGSCNVVWSSVLGARPASGVPRVYIPRFPDLLLPDPISYVPLVTLFGNVPSDSVVNGT